MADTIYLIRHAEKPDGTSAGVNELGVQDDKSLIVRGWQRAGTWAAYIGSGIPVPAQIYASDPEKEKLAPGDKEGSNSQRPLQTVSVVAVKLGLQTNVSFMKGQEPDLVVELNEQKGVTLVAWQHEAIPQIASLLTKGAADIPNPWPPGRFDVIWQFVRPNDAAGWQFSQVCPALMPDDSIDPIQAGN